MDEAELESCTGEELFKQLLRLLPTADPQDYMKNGAWQDTILKLDCRILIGHRCEAGAPDIGSLEDVKMPELPAAVAAAAAAAASAAQAAAVKAAATSAWQANGQVKSVGPQAVVNVLAKAKAASGFAQRVMAPKLAMQAGKMPASAMKPGVTSSKLAAAMKMIAAAKAAAKLSPLAGAKAGAKAGSAALGSGPMTPGMMRFAAGKQPIPVFGFGKPTSPAAKANPAYALGGGNVTSVVANDLSQISAFVSKWSLDTTKAKLALAKLTPQKRQYVLANFTNQAATNKYGTASNVPAITKLEQFIVKCNQSNSWGTASASSASSALFGGKKVAPVMPGLGAIGGRGGQVKRPLGFQSAADANKRLKMQAVPNAVPKVGGAGWKPTPQNWPKAKAAPPLQQSQSSRSNSWSSSSNGAAPNAWDSGKGSWGGGKGKGKDKSWGNSGAKPWEKAKKDQTPPGGLISSLLAKY